MSKDKQSDENSGGNTDVGTVARQTTMMGRLRAYLFAGILLTAPISITIYLTYIFLSIIDDQVAKILPNEWQNALYVETTFPGIGFIISLAFFIVVGWFATNFLGRFFIRLAEYFVDRMPIVRTLYGAIKQIFETIMASQSQAFREAVMLEYPRKGSWSIGFVTGRTQGEVQSVTDEDTINVFVPTTPNPTSGFLLFIPKKDLVYLDMSVEDAVKLVVSAGIITPDAKKLVKRKIKPLAKPKIKSTSKKKASYKSEIKNK